METIKLGDVVCFVKRSNRRTVGMRIGKDGTPEILAPKYASAGELLRLCAPYEEKLLEMSQKQMEINEEREAFTLSYGSYVRVLGGEREIREGRRGVVSYDDEAFYMPPGLTAEQIRVAALKLYKLLAKNYITERALHLAATMGLSVSAVKINSAKTHWATCSKKSSLNFSWYCIMAEPAAVDYIIVHELCHMREFNHSPRFWAEVEKYCPDYKRHKAYLKRLWQEIMRERWE